MRRTVMAAALAFSVAAPTYAQQDWSRVEQALGRPGQAQPDGTYKFSFPRTDLKVTVDGVEIKPALALGGWLAFQQEGGQASVMGDLVLTESEINPVMSKLVEHNIAVTALHNHLLRAQPTTMYMHVSCDGDPAKLASALRDALVVTKTPMVTAAAQPPQQAAGSAEQSDPVVAKIEQTLGHKGKMNGGVYQVSVPRAEPVQMMGVDVPDSAGTAIAMNFQPSGGGKVAATGDFVLIETEVEPVIHVLRQNGIEITALHNHMLMEEPRLFFMHFWANDDAEKVAKGLKAALEKTNAKRG
jgi:hypothetical protein